MPTGQSTLFNDPIYFDASKNPFVPTYIGQCTWYCWSKAHSKAAGYPDRNLDVSNLPTGNAGDWADIAEKNGYTVSMTPKADCIAVWNGHVAYVETVDGDNICFSEANWNNTANASGTIQVPNDFVESIRKYVAKLTSGVTVLSGGTDGEFKTLTFEKFKKRGDHILKGFIYLN